MPAFIKGLDLCESFFNEVARPLLQRDFPQLRYSAALIGFGSDTLGYDDAISTDHMWGPRFYLFLPEDDFEKQKAEIADTFSNGFPHQYRGYPTNFSLPDEADHGVRHPVLTSQGPINPLVGYETLKTFFESYLGYPPASEISISTWLTFTEHRLLGATSGRVFHDELGLQAIRETLAYFPEDVWLWMMAAQWAMIAEEEAFVGRCGSVGDEIGSALVASRQVQRLMRLSFLQEKRYAPYSKWFGTAFQTLDIAKALHLPLQRTLQASNWREREQALGQAYTQVAENHNRLKITPEISPALRDYFGRPFQVLFADRFVHALLAVIREDRLKEMPLIGSVSQFTESTAVFDNVDLYARLKNLYC